MDELHAEELTEALATAERRRREAQRLSGVGFWELDHRHGSLYWSEEIFAIYGLEANALEPSYEIFTSLIHDEDRDLVTSAYQQSVESGKGYDIRYRIKAGDAVKWIEARGVTYYDEAGQPERSIGTARDISEVIDAQQATEHLATHDALTDLPNRNLFSRQIEKALRVANSDRTLLAILFIDLDDFKRINDRHGHDVGDEVLISVARHLKSVPIQRSMFARIGGDEFVGLVTGADPAEIDLAVRHVKNAIETDYETRAGSFRVQASLGVTIYPQDTVAPDELLRHADHAMYEAKEMGKSRIRYFDATTHRSNRSRHQLLLDIEHAIRTGQFDLYFQPRVCLADGSLSGAEALLRWFRPEGPVSPVEVIEAISGTSLEWELDAWVVQAVLRQIEVFRAHGLQGPFSLNANPSTIEDDRLPALLSRLLATQGVSGQDLEIEILEVASIRSLERTNEILNRCKELGVGFSLDDFGTGYASLTYFQSLPIDRLKIDRRFVRELLSEKGSLALIKSILAIADANDCPVVAEGIESHDFARVLRNLGCAYGQGFGLARPMAVEDYLAWARTWRPETFTAALEDSE